MKQLLVAVDFSKSTSPILEQAAGLALALSAKLWVLHVTSDETQAMVDEATQFSDYAPEFIGIPSDVQLARDITAEEIKREHTQLQKISSKLRHDGVDAHALLLKGNAAEIILKKVKNLNVEMIIIGSHGHGLLHKALLGSVSENILRKAKCNIMIIPIPEH